MKRFHMHNSIHNFQYYRKKQLEKFLDKENKVNVKNVFLEDATEKCKVALWKDTAVQDIRSGDFVDITDVVINTFRNETSLTTTSRTKIIVITITLYLLQNIYQNDKHRTKYISLLIS